MALLIGLPFSDPKLRTLARILIGTIFIAAAIDKIANPDAFAKSINNFHLLLLLATHPLEYRRFWLGFYPSSS